MTANQKIIVTAMLLVGLAVGYVAGTASGNKRVADLRARVAGSSAMLPQATEVKQLFGSIKSINGETLILAVQPKDVLGDPALDERNVTIDATTKITVSTPKDPVSFQTEMSVYQDAMQKVKLGTPGQTNATSSRGTLPTPPEYVDKKEGDVSSLKVGQMINITTTENVKAQKDFVALTINILSTPISSATPAAPPVPAR